MRGPEATAGSIPIREKSSGTAEPHRDESTIEKMRESAAHGATVKESAVVCD